VKNKLKQMKKILSILVLASFAFVGCEPEEEVVVETPPRMITHSGSGSQTGVVSGENIIVSVQGSGSLKLTGTCNFAIINVSSSNSISGFNGTDLEIREAEVTNTGSGSISIWVTDRLNVKIQGSGNVYYKGNPQIISNIQGSGKLIKN
jgi:hypothetical protein